jgi:hypothetical protein
VINPGGLDQATHRRVLPFALLLLCGIARRVAPEGMLLGVDARWLELVSCMLVGSLLWHWRHQYPELTQPGKPTWRELGLAVLTGAVLCGCWTQLDQPWMRLGDATDGFRPVDAQGEIVVPWLLARVVGGVLVVPLATELFWRSFVLRRFAGSPFQAVDPKRAGTWAMVLSSLLFMLVATPWLAAFVAGLACAWLYGLSGKLWLPIVAHAVAFTGLATWVVVLGTWGFW